MRNSECGIRNYFVPHICHETLVFRRGGFYIRPIKNLAFIVIFCRGRVARPESRSGFSVYENVTKAKCPYFQRVYPMKIGTLVYCKTPCGAGRETRTLQFYDRLAVRINSASFRISNSEFYFIVSTLSILVLPATPRGIPAVITTMSFSSTSPWLFAASIAALKSSSVLLFSSIFTGTTPQLRLI